MSVKDTDKGYEAFKAALKRLARSSDPHITVGIHADKGSDEVVKAASNEYGTPTIPARPFLRPTIDANRDVYFNMLADGIGDVLDGKGSNIKTVFRKVAVRAVGDVKQAIRDVSTPPNAPSTVRRKGANNPLIDTGRMRASVDYKVET